MRITVYYFGIFLLLLAAGCPTGPNPLLTWEYTKHLSPEFTKSPEEESFVEALAKIAEANEIRACYFIESPHYFITHLLPLFHVFPSPFCGFKGNALSESLKSELLKRGYSEKYFVMAERNNVFSEYLTNSNKNLLILDTNPDHGWLDGYPGTSNLGHGVDEDHVYTFNLLLPLENPEAGVSLLFSRFNDTQHAVASELRAFYEIDPSKKTVFFAGSFGYLEFIDPKAPKAVRDQTMRQLKELKTKYNVVVRPHPLQDGQTQRELSENFKIAPPLAFPSFVPYYDIADVVVGNPTSSTMTTATEKPSLPLVVLRPHITWDRQSADDIAKRNDVRLLADATSILVNDEQILVPGSLSKAIESALFDNEENAARIEARKNYFKYWFGCVDGYEEYRDWIYLLEKAGVDASQLWELYATFPKYKNREICKQR